MTEESRKALETIRRWRKHPPTKRTSPLPWEGIPEEELREETFSGNPTLLRKELGQLNSALDPELVQAGITLAGYHIEAGARSFAAYTQAMLADLGEAARPYLRPGMKALDIIQALMQPPT